ncbi:MAG: hypothetical protein F4Z18_15330 [Caldilineaceae bacterium SB0666_bin_21]|nr:hypothetical protein [Caldilineaceae bacterium SB0666_bin_21]
MRGIPRGRVLAASLLLLPLLVLALAALAGAVHALWFTDRIYPGVYIAEVPMGGLTVAEARAVLAGLEPRDGLEPVLVELDARQFALGGTWDASDQALHLLIHRAWLQGRDGFPVANQIARWRLVLQGVYLDPPVVYDPVKAAELVAHVERSLERPGRPSMSVGSVQVPAIDGLEVDTEQLAADIAAAADGGQSDSIRVVADSPAADMPELLPTDFNRSTVVVEDPARGLRLALDPFQLSLAMQGPGFRELNLEVLETLVARWEPLLARPPREGRFAFDRSTGRLQVVAPSQTGLALDVEGTARAVADAVALGRNRVQAQFKVVEPVVGTDNPEAYGIRELVASGTTWFKGSSASRIHNIELTTSQLHNVMVPPGADFSFNDTVGAITAAIGYADSAIIWGDRTAVGVGGGVCQVSTTLFRAAFDGGFPIVERYNHGYVVSWYGQPGKDATIYSPYVDFRFRNDTGAWILIQPRLDLTQGTLTFDIFGTAFDRVVTVSEPVISDVIEPEEPLYLENSALAPGEQRLVETEKLGMTVTVDRTIVQHGRSRTETFRSVYQPWRAVYLVGYDPEAGADNADPTDQAPSAAGASA